MAFTYSYFFYPISFLFFFWGSSYIFVGLLDIAPHGTEVLCFFFSSLWPFFFIPQIDINNFYSSIICTLLLSPTVWGFLFVCFQFSAESTIYINSLQPLFLFILKHSSNSCFEILVCEFQYLDYVGISFYCVLFSFWP